MFSWLKNLFKNKSNLSEIPTSSTPANFPANNSSIYDFKFADVSHYEKVDFDLYDCKILITKATEGTSNVDSTFKSIKAQAKLKGLRFGAYHFFRCNLSAIEQAKFFLNTVGNFDLPPILDIEELNGASQEGCKQLIKSWLEYVEQKTGMIPVIYSGHSFLVELNLDQSFAKYPLWLARYTTIRPVPPAPWKEWTAWQYSDKDIFKGIGACDSNIYNGKLNGLGLK